MSIAAPQALLSLGSGGLVGLVLGLVGGGGSILAVPLLVYVVGIDQPHVAIGTAAIAVAVNAAFGLAMHARQGTVRWPCALSFALAGTAGAFLGAAVGKAVDGQRLLALFGLLMVVVAALMLRGNSAGGNPEVRLTTITAPAMMPWLAGAGLAVGILSGFFGIGGGFLIVPGLMLATGMPIANAMGSSLVAVTAFGLSTAASYAYSGLVDWRVAALMIAGGAAGSLAGTRLNRAIAQQKGLLTRLFAGMVMLVGAAVAVKGFSA